MIVYSVMPDPKIADNFPTLLQKLLKKAGMSSYALAKKLRVSTTAVLWWVSGKRLPSDLRIPEIAKALKINPRLLANALDLSKQELVGLPKATVNLFSRWILRPDVRGVFLTQDAELKTRSSYLTIPVWGTIPLTAFKLPIKSGLQLKKYVGFWQRTEIVVFELKQSTVSAPLLNPDALVAFWNRETGKPEVSTVRSSWEKFNMSPKLSSYMGTVIWSGCYMLPEKFYNAPPWTVSNFGPVKLPVLGTENQFNEVPSIVFSGNPFAGRLRQEDCFFLHAQASLPEKGITKGDNLIVTDKIEEKNIPVNSVVALYKEGSATILSYKNEQGHYSFQPKDEISWEILEGYKPMLVIWRDDYYLRKAEESSFSTDRMESGEASMSSEEKDRRDRIYGAEEEAKKKQ